MFSSVECFSNQNQEFSNHIVNEGVKINFTNNLLPLEVYFIIFSNLNIAELGNYCLTNKAWHLLANNEDFWKCGALGKKAFGKKQWETYFGEIGDEPPLPNDIYKILKSPCPFFPEKKVGETHILVLIPETVNGKPLTLTFLEELVRYPKEGKTTKYAYISDAIINNENINQANAKSYWVLMTKDVIPGSRDKSYADQNKMIAEVAEKTGINYEVPNLRDAIVCIFTYYATSRVRLFSGNPHTYTRCRESIQGYQLVVGGFSRPGINVLEDDLPGDAIGVAAFRKLV